MVITSSEEPRVRDSAAFYDKARRAGYLAGGIEPFRWLTGSGGFIDYTNPKTLRWWREIQNEFLCRDIDGWKLNGTGCFLVPLPQGCALIAAERTAA